MASAYLTSGNLSSAGNQKKWTFSAWIKKLSIGADNGFLGYFVGTTNYFQARFRSDDTIVFGNRDGGSWSVELIPNRLFRDTNAWYHIVFQYDSAQSTSSDRASIWINGVKETSFAASTYPSQNANTKIPNAGYPIDIGRAKKDSNTYYLDGQMAHVHFCDGYAYQASDFGETDATTGIWKPKVSPSGISYGTNGFFLKFDNSANMGLDSSGQSNNFTTNGTIIQAKDTPSNVFACLNRLQRYDDYNLSNGNNTFTSTSAAAHRCVHSTLSALSGKYYAEVKVIEVGGTYPQIGVINPDVITFTDYLGGSNKGYGYLSNGNKQYNNSATSYGNTYTTGDIIGIAMDLDNHKLYFHKNGTYQNSGVPTSGSTGTGAIDLATGVFYSFGQSAYDSGTDPVYDWNFGNGYFGTTAVASAQSPDDGNGVFEYDVPAGYRALCTKSLNAEEYS